MLLILPKSGCFLAVLDPVLSPASPQADALARLFVVTLFVCAVILVIVSALVLLCIVRFRRKDGDKEPKQIDGNEKLEISWTAASILILVGLFTLTVRAMRIADPAPDRTPDLTVIGHQWWWEVRYPDGTVDANEIHIPVQSNLLVRLEAVDVIHDFWVPQLGRKMDMVPGHSNMIWMSANTPGMYLGACAEYCGAEHAWMRIQVEAQTSAEYEKWLEQQRPYTRTPVSEAVQRGFHRFHQKTRLHFGAIKIVDTEKSAE